MWTWLLAAPPFFSFLFSPWGFLFLFSLLHSYDVMLSMTAFSHYSYSFSVCVNDSTSHSRKGWLGLLLFSFIVSFTYTHI